jgi:allantoicase
MRHQEVSIQEKAKWQREAWRMEGWTGKRKRSREYDLSRLFL